MFHEHSYVFLTDRPLMAKLATVLDREVRGDWYLVTDPADLTYERMAEIGPDYIFVPHWSRKIPADVYENFCVVIFHMTDLPYGRGGSPLQNLIVRGHTSTMITALRCAAELDAGPIFIKAPLSLHGAADEIFQRARELIAGMIRDIVTSRPVPLPQEGDPVYFKRRKPADGDIRQVKDLDQVHDFIRMLDGDGYPPAFLETDHFRFEFSRSVNRDGCIEADVRITAKNDTGKPRAEGSTLNED